MQLSEQDQKDFDRSIQAERIMQEPLVLEALATMDRDIHALWSGEDIPDGVVLGAAEREELYRMLQAKNRFIAAFERYLQNGATARHILGHEPPRKTFLQRIKEYLK
jgi:hypothetical protein